MINLMIRIVTLVTCSIALAAAFSFTPVVAAGGGGGGGGGADGGATYGGMDQRSASPPSSYPNRSVPRPLTSPRSKKPSNPFTTIPLLPRVIAKPMQPSMTAMNMPRPSSS